MTQQVTKKTVDSVACMVKALDHRGPDESQISEMPKAVFGHTRLSIIDVSNGQQPMKSSDGDVCISFNGEIYGYREIRRNLEKQGVQFVTNSDTEVILELYQLYGTSMLSHLPGAFAFSIWDARYQRLFCARDRAGEKPFYYALSNAGLIFASEMKAITKSLFLTPQINELSLIHYLNRGYVSPQSTILNNVETLPPAHYMIYQDGKVKIDKYWTLPDKQVNLSLSDAVEGFSDALTSAVKSQFVADVDVNFFLSGGLDSSTLVSIGSGLSENISTISFGYNGKESELPYAREVAKLYGTHSVEVKEDSIDPFDAMKALAKVYDEPFWDTSSIATYQICASARKYGKVVITGDGADELLGGYTWWYSSLALLEEFSGLSCMKKSKQMTSDLLKLIVRKLTLGTIDFEGLYERNGAFYKNIALGRSPMEVRIRDNWFSKKNQLSKMGFDLNTIDQAIPLYSNFQGNVNDSLKGDFLDYLPGNMLVKVDRAAMANSLEARMPFLDVSLISFVSSLPSSYKVTSKSDKILLRQAFESKWPQSIRSRKKQGFGVNSNRWSEFTNYQKYMDNYVNNSQSKIYSHIDFNGTKEFIKRNEGAEYSVLMLAMWADNYAT